jgi:hypothetical protein
VIDVDEIRAILAKMAREIEPIYDPAPKIEEAIVSLAHVINQEWSKTLQETTGQVLRAVDSFDDRLSTALATLSADDSARVRAILAESGA